MIKPITIHAGDTRLWNTIDVMQTGQMQLTVRKGQFTTTGDARAQVPSETVTIPADVVFNLTSDPTAPKAYLLEIGRLNGTPDVLGRSQIEGEAIPGPPTGWQGVQWIAAIPVLPAGATSLDAVEVRVFTVLPGFPPGTTGADWQVQQGVTPCH